MTRIRSRTILQIFVAGRSIGGCDDLLSQLADGSFQRVLAEAKVATAAAVPADLLAAIQTAQLRAREAAEAQVRRIRGRLCLSGKM